MQTLRAIYSIKVLDSDYGNAELLFTDRSQSSKIAVYVVSDRKKLESQAAKVDFHTNTHDINYQITIDSGDA